MKEEPGKKCQTQERLLTLEKRKAAPLTTNSGGSKEESYFQSPSLNLAAAAKSSETSRSRNLFHSGGMERRAVCQPLLHWTLHTLALS